MTMAPQNRIRVEADALPQVQQFRSEHGSPNANPLHPRGVGDGPAQQYVREMLRVGEYTRKELVRLQGSLSMDVEQIYASLQDLMETDRRAADELKKLLTALEADDTPSAGGGGAAAAPGISGGEGTREGW